MFSKPGSAPALCATRCWVSPWSISGPPCISSLPRGSFAGRAASQAWSRQAVPHDEIPGGEMEAIATQDRKQTMTAASTADQIEARVKELTENDPQFREALPLPAVNEAKVKSELGLAQIAALVMEAYADRPALAQRATELATDPANGRRTRRLLKRYETITYRELWSRACALANVWHHDTARRLRADDLLCILAFAGIDFATVDLAAIHNGAGVVRSEEHTS